MKALRVSSVAQLNRALFCRNGWCGFESHRGYVLISILCVGAQSKKERDSLRKKLTRLLVREQSH